MRVGQVKSPAAAGTATSLRIDTVRLGHRPPPMSMTPSPPLPSSAAAVSVIA